MFNQVIGWTPTNHTHTTTPWMTTTIGTSGTAYSIPPLNFTLGTLNTHIIKEGHELINAVGRVACSGVFSSKNDNFETAVMILCILLAKSDFLFQSDENPCEFQVIGLSSGTIKFHRNRVIAGSAVYSYGEFLWVLRNTNY